MSGFVVRTHSPRRSLVLGVSLVLLAIGGGWASFEFGRATAGFDYSSVREERRELRERVDRLEAENRRLQEQFTLTTRSGQVDRMAHEEVRQTLSGLNAEILRLREELAFYQGIVSPGDSRRGLRIHSFLLEPTVEPRVYRFRMMLIQAMQHDRQARGNAEITVVGTEQGVSRRYPVPELSERYENGVPFDFRYFQEVEGDILLPEGFSPNRVEVALHARGESSPRVEQVFDWPEGRPQEE